MYTMIASIRRFSTVRHHGTIGFIGIGNMGAFMAKNLLKHSKAVVVYDVNNTAVQNLISAGAKPADDIASVAKSCTTIITMLPATAHVTEVLRGPTGVFANAKKGTMIIDCSTIDPTASRQLNEEATKLGFRMIDAPASGGVNGAEAGTLTFMVGGTSTNFEAAKEILGCMGKNKIHCGDAGAGANVKLCNNLALGIQMIATSEALSLGTRLGVDPKVLAAVMNSSTSRCWSSDTYNPCPGVMPNVPASRNYTGGFAVGLMRKDLTLAVEAANNTATPLPLGAAAHQLYTILMKNGYETKDFSSVFEYLSKK
jgi:3-hydroxyisobutyrate dehydrogenase